MIKINQIPGAEVAERKDQAKKLYRYINDIARKIDEGQESCKDIPQLFATSLEISRQKIRDYCEKLMFVDPLAYGRKAAELLWRKGYYEAVACAKRLATNDDDQYYPYVSTHLMCGIGHFHQIIARIQIETGLKLVDSIDYPILQGDSEKNNDLYNLDADLLQWGKSMIHSCLVYLGDLSRYRIEFFNYLDTSIASRYYLQAAYIDSTSGTPYNQMGTLYGERNHNLDSVSHYLHSLSCLAPFIGAEENLIRLFQANATAFQTLSNNSDALTQADQVTILIQRILKLADYWFLGSECDDVGQLCNATVQDLAICLQFETEPPPDANQDYDNYLQHLEDSTLNPNYLNDDLVYKIVVICLFCHEKLSKVDPSRAFTVKAFLLAMFSQLLQKLSKTLKKFGFLNPVVIKRIVTNGNRIGISKTPNNNLNIIKQKNGINEHNIIEIDIEDNKHSSELEANGDTKQNGNGDLSKPDSEDEEFSQLEPLKVYRRRRLQRSSESSAASDDDISVVEHLSVSEHSSSSDGSQHSSAQSSDQSEESEAEIKEDVIKPETYVKAVPKNKSDDEAVSEYMDESETEDNISTLKADDVLNFLQGDNMLPSLFLLHSWASKEIELMVSCGSSGDLLFQSLVDILNIYMVHLCGKHSLRVEPQKNRILDLVQSTVMRLRLTKEYKLIPLPEDIHLRATDVCRFEKDSSVWEASRSHRRSLYEDNVIRILNFIDFGFTLNKVVPSVTYNRMLKLFTLRKDYQPSKAERKSHKRAPHDPKRKLLKTSLKSSLSHNKTHNSGPNDTSLMRNLGRLWLQGQVRALESEVSRGRRSAAPAYVTIDTSALAEHTKTVKQLVAAKKFIVLIPTVVLQAMDELKKDSSGARDAIRWLEEQLRRGSRYVRAQRPAEHTPLPRLTLPRRLAKEAHTYLQIVQFCHYFISDDKTNKENIIVLLTGSKPNEPMLQCKDFSYSGVAQTAGVTVEYIKDFFEKWKPSINKMAKKR